MYAVRCPQCGQPVPVQLLARPDHLACSACRYAGPPPAETIAELERAAAVLRQYDVRERQLSGFQRRMATSSRFRNVVYSAALTFALSPFVCCLTYYLATSVGAGPFNWAWLILGAMPIAIVLLFGVSGFMFMRSRLARVRELVAAIPPPAPGQPAGCHLCGGEVSPAPGEAFARCPYCGTDNLTDPAVLAKLTTRRDVVLDGFEARTAEHARIAGQAMRSAMRGLIIGTIAAVPVSCACTTPIMAIMWQTETEPYAELEYSVVDTRSGRCLVAVVPHPLESEQVVLHGHWTGNEALSMYRLRTDVPRFRYRRLIGLRVEEQVAGHGEMVIERVFGTAGTAENRVVMRADDGFVRQDFPTKLCLTDDVTSPVAPIPMTVPDP